MSQLPLAQTFFAALKGVLWRLVLVSNHPDLPDVDHLRVARNQWSDLPGEALQKFHVHHAVHEESVVPAAYGCVLLIVPVARNFGTYAIGLTLHLTPGVPMEEFTRNDLLLTFLLQQLVIICWLDQDGDSSARIQLAEDSLPGLNEEAYVVSNGTETCDPHSVADTGERSRPFSSQTGFLASCEFLMLQATPAELGWMACQNVPKLGKHSEENSMLS